ncbi:MAG: protease pro-enzyme activation domain-containing protein [Terracidiphilus sp.]
MYSLPRLRSLSTPSLFLFRDRRKFESHFWCWLASLAALLCLIPRTTAQTTGTPDASGTCPLITLAVDDAQRTTLRGNTHPLVRRALDQGAAPSSLPMQHMILVLKRSADQESALHALLDAQQTRGSSSYHQWLAPQEFGKEFGPADSDIAAVEAWLESHGFKVESVSNGRTAIEFSGTAGQVQDAFQTSIHSYLLNGEQHWANASDPSIPSALAPAVKGVLSLHNFPRRPQFTVMGAQAQAANSGRGEPLYTFTSGESNYYAVGPTDWATIYNVLPLWNAGIDGAGQTIAIVGETDINPSDIAAFRSLFGLPVNIPKIIVNGTDPGISPGDEPEAVLDVSWSGAVARNATIDLVASATTTTALGVDLSALYIVDNNVAPIMSESYGECEATLGDAGNAFYNSLWEQAAAEGITVVEAAGDGGSAGCDDFNSEALASQGLGVSGFASTPYNVAVGGTDFDQSATTAPNYWSATNVASTEASALGYIPETVWNQSCAGQGLSNGVSQCPTSSSDLNIVAGSGGPSSCATGGDSGNCAGYPKPSWQTGLGVPQDGVRDLPDVSLFASAGFNGSFYIICEQDFTPFGVILGADFPCSLANETFVGVGGTSAAAPTFAGILALVEQKAGSRQGNANYVLYNLAAQPGASCNSSAAPANGGACVFYDITKGNDAVPCSGTLDCGFAPGSGGYGIMMDPDDPAVPAWTTTAGYDLATGLGSVNVANLVTAWSSASFSPSATTLVSLTPVSLAHGQAVSVNVTVAPKSATGTPTGSVALMAAVNGGSTAIANFPLVNGAASETTTLLPGGTYNVTAHYPGDGTFAASDSAPVEVTVAKENSQTALSLEAYNPTTQTFSPASATVPYGSIFYIHGDVTNAAGTPCTPSQLETQIPCPTGNLNLTVPGIAFASGTLALNTQGYTEDQTLYGAIPAAGTYAIQTQYSGDVSYNPGNPATMNLVVTPAPTGMDLLEIPDLSEQFGPGIANYLADSGQTFHVETAVTAASVRPAPTGVISFLENGAPVAGTAAYVAFNGSPDLFGAWAYLNGQLPVTINTPGTYTFTASYPGDGNYMAAQTLFSIAVVVSDQTFQITPPITNVTVTAGQAGTTSVTLTAVNNFGGVVNVTCTLPAAMAEATCPASSAALGNNATATAPLTITTTAPHPLTSTVAEGRQPYGFAVLACVFLLLPIRFRRKLPLLMLFVVLAVGFNGCGGGGQSHQDQGTPPGTYMVTVTATSLNITRTSTFTVTVE